MPMYKVQWEIDIVADTPREAAKGALKVQRDACSIATAFDVFDENGHTFVDLEEDDNTDWS